MSYDKCKLTYAQCKAFLIGKKAYIKGLELYEMRGQWAKNGWIYEKGYKTCIECKSPDINENHFFWMGYERALNKLNKQYEG